MVSRLLHSSCKALEFTRFASTLKSQPVLKHTERIITAAPQYIYKPKTIFRRPLDGFESLMLELYQRNLHYVYCCMSLKSKVPLKEETVRHAMALVSQRHPLLRSIVVNSPNTEDKYFECIHGYQDKNIELLVVDKSIDDQIAAVEELMATRTLYLEGSLLWRTALLQEVFDSSSNCYHNALILFFCHSIGKASSLLLVSRELLSFIEVLSKGSVIKLEDIKGFPLLPSSISLLSRKLKTYKKSNDASFPTSVPKSFIHPVLSDFPTIENPNTEKNIQPIPRIMVRKLSKESLSKLLISCRKYNCTLTGTIQAACHMAFCSLLKTQPLSTHLTYDITYTTSIAKHLYPSLPSDYLTGSFGVLKQSLHLTTDYGSFWILANACTKNIHSDISREKDLEYLSLLNDDWKSMLNLVVSETKLKLANRRRPQHSMSNALTSAFKNQENNNFQLESFFGGSPGHARHGTFGNYLVTVNGVLMWVTCYNKAIISTEVALRYYDCIGEILQNVILESDIS